MATFTDEASSSSRKRSRTDFTADLMVPLDMKRENTVKNVKEMKDNDAGAERNHEDEGDCWVETLPDVQLRSERDIRDPRARGCQSHRHR